MGDSYVTLHARVGDCSRSEVALRKIRRRKSLPQPAQARFMAARGFLKLEAEALRNGDDVIEETFVPSSWIGVGRHGRRTVASRVLGPFLPTVRGEEAGRGCLSDLAGCPLEIEVPRSVWGQQDTNAAHHCVRDPAVLCRIAGEDIGRIDLFERGAAVNVGFGDGTPLTRRRIGCSRGARATPPRAAGTSGSPRDCRRSSNRTRCLGRRAG